MPKAARTQQVETRPLSDQATPSNGVEATKSLSEFDFVVRNTGHDASRSVAEDEPWVLSREDSEFFVNAILNPPEPAPALKESARWFKERMRLK